jgi:hypothetical protein
VYISKRSIVISIIMRPTRQQVTSELHSIFEKKRKQILLRLSYCYTKFMQWDWSFSWKISSGELSKTLATGRIQILLHYIKNEDAASHDPIRISYLKVFFKRVLQMSLDKYMVIWGFELKKKNICKPLGEAWLVADLI